MEGSFGRAANEHGFKRSRWRRLWRQQIQDWLIAAVQNVKQLMRAGGKRLESGVAAVRCEVLMTARARVRQVRLGPPPGPRWNRPPN